MSDIPGRGNSGTLRIIGLGNELLTDDGVGIRVVRAIKDRIRAGNVSFEELSVGGLKLLDYITDVDCCILVDAVVTGSHPAGTMFRFSQPPDALPAGLSSSHQIDLGQVMALGALLGAKLARNLTVYGIEVSDVTTFQEGCTEAVSAAIPRLVEVICADIESSRSVATGTGTWELVKDEVPV